MPRGPTPELPPDPLARWSQVARSQPEDSPRLPISVLVGEAIELSHFL
jgi:hypothetical protein